MNPCCIRRSRLSRSLALLLAYLIAAEPFHVALAGPEGGVVVGGSAVIDATTPGVTAISQGSQRAIIDWRGFSSATGEAIRFAQPSSTAAILNRVTGPGASLLRGSLTANGQVFLLNPNGVVFGPTSQVAVGSLVASSLEMTNADFMAGRHNLTATPSRALAAVVNQGAIRTEPGGAVVMVGPVVSNQGIIEAPSGRVALAAGTRAVVNLDGAQLVNLALPEGAARDVAVPAAGVSDALKRAVNDDGIVEAGSVQEVGGRIVLGGAEGLAINEGTIDANASAGQSAGHVRVSSTRATVVAPGARITASGVGGRSNGGDVRLLSGGTTVFTGTAHVDAMAGTTGDGGFVEVSGDTRVYALGGVNTSAPGGKTGMYLIDPQDLTIVNGARASTDQDGAAGDGLVSTGDPDAGANTISEAVLEGLSQTQITLQATNSITIQDIDDGVGDKLTLNGSLELRTLNGNITFLDPTNTIEITFGAGASVSIHAGTSASAVASVTLGNITTIGNNVDVTSGTAGGDITFGTFDAGTGSVDMSAPLGNITGGAITGGRILLRANSAVGTPKNVSVGTMTSRVGSVQLFAGNPGGNALDGQAQSYRGGVSFTSINAAADAVIRFGNGDVSGGDVTAGGEINIQATFNDGLPGNITLGRVTTDGNPTTVPDASFDPFGDIVLRSGYGGGDIRFTSLTNRRTGVFVNAVAGDVVGGDVRGGPSARNVVIESRRAPTGGSVTVGNVIADAANVGMATVGLGGNIRYASIAANQAGVDGSGRVQLDAPGGSVDGGSITAAGSKANTREAIIVRTSSTAGASGSIAVGALRSTQAGASIVLQSRTGQGSSSGGAVSVPSIETNSGRVTIDSFDPITFTSIAADTVILANGRGDLRFSAPPSGGPNVTARVLTILSSQIGSAVNPLRTMVSGLNALAGGGSMHIQNSGSLTLGTVVASADLTGDVFITAAGGDLSVGEVSATREVSLSTPDGSILRAGQGVPPNIIARKATLSARDVIGTLAAPLDVDVGGSREGLEGTLTESHGVQLTGELLTGNPRTQGRLAPPLGGVSVSASGLRDGVSVDITGVAKPADTLTILNCPPGLVVFNGVALEHCAPTPTIVPTPPATPPPTATVQPVPTSTPAPPPSVVPTPTPPPTVVPTPTPTSQPPPPVVVPPQLGARERLADLLLVVRGLGLPNGVTHSLYSKLENAQALLERGDTRPALQLMGAFKQEVRALPEGLIPSEVAEALLAAADEIIAAIGNPAR